MGVGHTVIVVFSLMRFSTTIMATSAASTSAAPKAAHHQAGSHPYASIPDEYILQQVVVVHRHGDRSQIARSIGLNHPESAETAEAWSTKMPSAASLRAMAAVAQSQLTDLEAPEARSLVDEIYSGEDKASRPYAQLTERGVLQLIAVGRALRNRYLDGPARLRLLPDASLGAAATHVYARSTNMCRTLQSLRSLLAGFYAVDGGEEAGASTASALGDATALRIHTRPKVREVMFPGADGPCEAMAARRNVVFPPDYMDNHWPGFGELEARVKTLLGYQDRVAWLTVKEILTCSKEHGLAFPPGITLEDEAHIGSLAGWMWGRVYSDTQLNRLAIGRFVCEMADDLRAAMGPAPADESANPATAFASAAGKKLLLYSGHDSTLVPLLCALECYDGVWPPYASFLSLEIAQDRASGERFVRALYNDREVHMLGQPGPWCAFDVFFSALERVSLRHDDYRAQCSGAEAGLAGEVKASANAKAYEAEVKATIGI